MTIHSVIVTTGWQIAFLDLSRMLNISSDYLDWRERERNRMGSMEWLDWTVCMLMTWKPVSHDTIPLSLQTAVWNKTTEPDLDENWNGIDLHVPSLYPFHQKLKCWRLPSRWPTGQTAFHYKRMNFFSSALVLKQINTSKPISRFAPTTC